MSTNKSFLEARLEQMEATQRENANKFPAPTPRSDMSNGIRKQTEKEWRKITVQALLELEQPRRSKAQEAEHQLKKEARRKRKAEARAAAKQEPAAHFTALQAA